MKWTQVELMSLGQLTYGPLSFLMNYWPLVVTHSRNLYAISFILCNLYFWKFNGS